MESWNLSDKKFLNSILNYAIQVIEHNCASAKGYKQNLFGEIQCVSCGELIVSLNNIEEMIRRGVIVPPPSYRITNKAKVINFTISLLEREISKLSKQLKDNNLLLKDRINISGKIKNFEKDLTTLQSELSKLNSIT